MEKYSRIYNNVTKNSCKRGDRLQTPQSHRECLVCIGGFKPWTWDIQYTLHRCCTLSKHVLCFKWAYRANTHVHIGAQNKHRGNKQPHKASSSRFMSRPGLYWEQPCQPLSHNPSHTSMHILYPSIGKEKICSYTKKQKEGGKWEPAIWEHVCSTEAVVLCAFISFLKLHYVKHLELPLCMKYAVGIHIWLSSKSTGSGGGSIQVLYSSKCTNTTL